MRIFHLLVATLYLIMINPLLAASARDEWQLTTANISIIKYDGNKLKVEGTPLDQLLKLNKRSLWSLMEVGGTTVLTMVISYRPADQNKFINQIGFYRTFNLAIQHELEFRGVMYKSIQSKIAYLKNNPLNIRFFIKGTLENVPPLITKPNSVGP